MDIEQIKAQTLKAQSEMVILRGMVEYWPDKRAEVQRIINILSSWVLGIEGEGEKKWEGRE